MTMLNQNAPQEARTPLAEYSALTKSATPLQRDMQEETGQATKKGSLSEDAVYLASAVEAPDHVRSASVSSPDAVAHPHTCGRQTLPGLHSYDRD